MDPVWKCDETEIWEVELAGSTTPREIGVSFKLVFENSGGLVSPAGWFLQTHGY